MGRELNEDIETRRGDKAEAAGDTDSRLLDDVAGERRKLASADVLARAEATGERAEKAQEKDPEPGVVKNRDGSEVEYARAADGKVHPVRLKYTNGDSTEYTYDRNGNVSDFTNRRADGSVRERWISADGGKTFREERAPANFPAREMNLKVNRDGTAVMSDGQGNTAESMRDGSLMMRFKDAQGNPHKVKANADGSAIEFGKFSDGKERPIVIVQPDGKQIHYGYNSDGSIADVSEWTAGGPQGGGRRIVKYQTRNGSDWNEEFGAGPPFSDKLEMRPDGTHVFTDANTGGTWERKPNGSITIKDKDGKVVSESPPIPAPRR